ncbi:hypothetical protein Vafri_2367 [Volvox africanus]|nr:hypothetical protein Vafri_2367 [Volvox africanus]
MSKLDRHTLATLASLPYFLGLTDIVRDTHPYLQAITTRQGIWSPAAAPGRGITRGAFTLSDTVRYLDSREAHRLEGLQGLMVATAAAAASTPSPLAPPAPRRGHSPMWMILADPDLAALVRCSMPYCSTPPGGVWARCSTSTNRLSPRCLTVWCTATAISVSAAVRTRRIGYRVWGRHRHRHRARHRAWHRA